MKTAFNILGALAFAMALSACGKKSSSSSTATTPTNVCTTGYYYSGGIYYNQGGAVCTISTVGVGTNSCLSGNYSYNPTTGQYVDNTTGQPVNCTGTGVGTLPGYGYQGGQYYSGCSYWSQIYGVQYYPVNIGNQISCVRADLLNQYGVPTYGGYQQQYYTCQYGINCGSSGPYYGYPGYGQSGGCVNFGGSGWGQQYGISGNIGLCW